MWIRKIILLSLLVIQVAKTHANELGYFHQNECPGTSVGTRCFVPSSPQASLSWADAEATCQRDHGGHLIMIDDDIVKNMALRMMGDSPGEKFWIGLSDWSTEGTFVWTNGQSYTYTDWEPPTQPDNRNGVENCVEMKMYGDKVAFWNDVDCLLKRPYICETRTTLPNCELEWNGRCFAHFNVSLNHSESRELCHKFPKGALLKMDAREILDLLKTNLTKCTGEFAWLQATRLGNDFVWDNGTVVNVPLDFWAIDEPNNYFGNENCTHYRCKEHAWNDRKCDNNLTALCEWELPICTHRLGNTCYSMISQVGNYNEAVAKCKETYPDGTLARIDSHEIHDFIKDNVPCNLASPYIQARRFNPNTVYVWGNGDPVPSWFWASGQPNFAYSSQPAECVALQCTHDNTWNDVDCEAGMAALCEWQVPQDVHTTFSPTRSPVEGALGNPIPPTISPTTETQPLIVGGAVVGSIVVLAGILFVAVKRANARKRDQLPIGAVVKSSYASSLQELEEYDLFLAHAWGKDGRNHQRVKNIAAELEKRGMTVWVDSKYAHGDIDEAMLAGIDASKLFVAFITKEYMEKVNSGQFSDHCRAEFEYALRRGKTILPVTMDKFMKKQKNWRGKLALRIPVSELLVDFSGTEDMDYLHESIARKLEQLKIRKLLKTKCILFVWHRRKEEFQF